MPDRIRKTRRTNRIKHFHTKNIIFTLVLLACLSVIYKFNFRTKSEILETVPVSFKECTEYESKDEDLKDDKNVLIEVQYDENGERFINFPDKINGYHVSSYRVLSSANGEKIAGKEDVGNTANTTNKIDVVNTIQSVNSNTNINTNSNATNANMTNITNSNSNSTSSNETINSTKNFSYLQRPGSRRNFYSEEKIENEDIIKKESGNEESDKESNDNGDNVVEDEKNKSDESGNSNTKVDNRDEDDTEKNSNEVNSNDNTVEKEEPEEEKENNTSSEKEVSSDDAAKDEEDKEDEKEKDKSDDDEKSKKQAPIVEETVRERTYLPGEKYYLTEDEILSFEVIYKTAIIKGKKLYKRDISFVDEGTTITAVGYMPDGFELAVKPENKEEMMELKKDVKVEDDAIDLGKTEVLAAYDISIVKYDIPSVENDEKDNKDKNEEEKNNRKVIEEYQPKDYEQTIEISISSKEELTGKLGSGTIIPVHVRKSTEEMTNDEGQTFDAETYEFDQINISNKTEDGVEFYTDSFSTFMVLRLLVINPNQLEIDDRVSDKNYYTGKNYTDNLAGTNQNLYRDDNEVEVIVNYYGYDDVNGPTVAVVDGNNDPTYDPVTGELIEERACGYISNTERYNLMTYKLTRYKDASNNISIELIDNPFMDRPVNNLDKYQPVGYGFNGWLSHSSDDVITTDMDSFQQTLTKNVGTNTSVTIDLYVDWRPATYIFLSTNGNNNRYLNHANNTLYTNNECNPGTDPTQPLNTTALAMTRINNNYKNATKASNRELNIIVLQYGNYDFFLPTNAVTITSLYDGQSTKSANTYFNINASRILNYDLQLDYLNTNCGSYNRDPGQRFNETNYYMIGNGKNLRIGRGMMPVNTGNDRSTFTQVYGGFNADVSSANAKNYKLVVESGKYSTIVLGNGTGRGRGTVYSSAIGIFGSDVDRANNNNADFNVYAGLFGRTGAGTIYPKVSGGYTYDMRVRSGTICVPYFDSRASQYVYSGIYLGGTSNAGTAGDKGHKRLIIEGGNIANIMGGRSVLQTDALTSHTHVYVKGGTVANIVGGAGAATGYGNRAVQVTGGTIRYSVSGAANGFSSGNGQGNLPSACMVYIGGNAVIGTETGSLYDVPAGSVHGAGNGNNGARQTAGLAGSTHVIIDGNAQIKGSVYAGGNYGQVKPADYSGDTQYIIERTNESNSYNTSDQYIISTGLNNGSHYLYYVGNNTATGRGTLSDSEVANTGKWKLVQTTGGYYIQSVSNPNRYLNVYYERRGNMWTGYSYTYQARTADSRQVFTLTQSGSAIKLSTRSSDGVLNFIAPESSYTYNNTTFSHVVQDGNDTRASIYLIKETKTPVPIPDDYPGNVVAQVDVLGGSIAGNVYGGSNNNDISGSSLINVKDGTISGTVYGGSNTSGVIKEYTTINVTGGTIGTGTNGDAIFAGGKGNGTTITGKAMVNISNTDSDTEINGNIYGGSEEGLVNGKSNVKVDKDLTSTNNITLTSKIFGGGKGTNNRTAVNGNNTTVIVEGLDDTSNVTVYGGANVKGRTDGNILVKIGENKTTYVKEVYGGGESANVLAATDSVYVYIYDNATVKNVYGGGMNAGIEGTHQSLPRAIYIDGATIVENVYGGSNQSGTMADSNVYLSNSATATEVFGGGFGQNTTVTNTNVVVDDSSATNIYGGGNQGKVNGTNTTGTTNVVVQNSSGITGVYAGGKGNQAVVTGTTYAKIDNSTINSYVFGGGNAGQVNGNTKIEIINGSNVNEAFGGGSVATVSGNTEVNVNSNSEVTKVFGGGSLGVVTGSTDVNILNAEIGTVYGGGQGAAAVVQTDTDVDIDNSTITVAVYGGGDSADVIGDTTVLIEGGSTVENVYGGGNKGKVGDTSDPNNVVISDTSVTIENSTVNENVFGGGNEGNVTGTCETSMSGSTATKLYGGGQSATVGNTVVSITDSSNLEYAFGGGQGSTATTTGHTSLIVNGSTITKDVYGGGDAGQVDDYTVVGLTNATIGGNAYAAGNGETATVGNNSYIYAEGTTNITKSIFGGGNAATTGTDPAPDTENGNICNSWAIVDIAGATIGKNVYGGANSSVIIGHTIVNVGVDAISEFYANPAVTDISDSNEIIPISIVNPNKKNSYVQDSISIGNTIFGGGEQMVEGNDEYNFNSISVEGVITINVNGTNYDSTYGMNIGGSIFGSGNASSANRNGDITIKNYGKETDVKRLISIQRAGIVTIQNSNISIQGISDSTNAFGNVDYSLNIIEQLKIKDNTRLYLYNGANRLSSYVSAYTNGSQESMNRVSIKNNVYDENNNLIYIIDGNKFCDSSNHVIAYIGENNKYFTAANLNTEVDQDTKDEIADLIAQAANIVTQSVTTDTDNRIYMFSGKNLNLSTKEDEEMYSNPGTVKGMTFFGLFKEGSTPGSIFTGIFDKNYTLGTSISYNERDFASAYVMGYHYTNPEHDILVDGFYTNYENVPSDYETYMDMEEDVDGYHSTAYSSVITPTPQSATYYRWYAKPGNKIYRFDFKLTASKFSTLGTINKQLVFDDVYPNAVISNIKVSATVVNPYGLYDKNTIPNVAPTDEEALQRFGLSMKTGNAGWKMNAETDFFFDPSTGTASYLGDDVFEIENSNTVPTFSFYLFNSNNITDKLVLGEYTITMDMEYPIDALNKGTATLIFGIGLETDNYNDRIGYNATITPGEQFEIFSSSDTSISNKSSFSTFFELAQEDFKNAVYLTDQGVDHYVSEVYHNNSDLHRYVATRNYVFPKGTTITMIDKTIADNPKYYYYNVTQADVNNNKTEFAFEDFYVMGGIDDKYDEEASQGIYYNSTTGYEYESFILIFNFNASEFPNLHDELETETIVKEQPITIQLRANVLGVSRSIFTVLDMQAEKFMKFSIYKAETAIDISGSLNKTRIYLGNQVRLTATTSYTVAKVRDEITGNETDVFDTRYFDKKLGIVISVYEVGTGNNPDRKLEGADVLGLSFSLNGATYYPRADGTTRIKLAEKVSNVYSAITIDTENASLASGDYYFILQSFGSADGIYFGTDVSAVSTPIRFKIINDIFGLNASAPDRETIVEGDNGCILNEEGKLSDDNEVTVTLGYQSGLANPFLGVSLYRRKYDTVYGNEYEKVDLADYVRETLENVTISYSDPSLNLYEYKAVDVDTIHNAVTDPTQSVSFTQNYTYEEGPLMTGTYKLVYTLYDRYDTQIVVEDQEGTMSYQDVQEYEKIGEDFVYIIIK